MRYISLFFYIKRMYLKGKLTYKLNFLLEIVGNFLSVGTWLLGIAIVLNEYGNIGGWDFKDILLMVSLFNFSWSIAGLIGFHLYELIFEIRNGTYINYLLKPLPPLFYYLASKFPLQTIGAFITSTLLLTFSLYYSDLLFNLKIITLIFFSCISGIMLILGSFIINGSLAFLNIDSTIFYVNILSKLREMSRLPLFIFPWYLVLLLIVIIPYGLVAFIPLHFILNYSNSILAEIFTFTSPIIGALYLLFSIWIWKKLSFKYEFTGS